MVHGSWCMVHGAWSMVHGPWSMVHGPWSMVHGPWSMVHGPWFMVHGPWFMVHGSWCMVHGTMRRPAFCSFLCSFMWLEIKTEGAGRTIAAYICKWHCNANVCRKKTRKQVPVYILQRTIVFGNHFSGDNFYKFSRASGSPRGQTQKRDG